MTTLVTGITTAAAPSAVPSSTRSEWDPVTFRMAEVSPRGMAARREERASWAAVPPLPEPRRWAGSIAKAAVECLLGVRPAPQLARWIDGPVYEALARRAGLANRMLGSHRAASTRLISAHVQERGDGSVEATVTIHDGARVRAAALLLEVFHGRWLVTSLEIG